MSRGILIGDKHTFNDWGLILTSADIGYPMPKTEYIDIPHGDGSIDLTEALTGEVKYSNREGTFEFDLIANPNERVNIMNEIASYLHGKVHTIVLPDEPDFIYIGRLSINQLKTSYMLNKLVINVISNPYKLKPEVMIKELRLVENLIPNGWDSFKPYGSGKNVIRNWNFINNNLEEFSAWNMSLSIRDKKLTIENEGHVTANVRLPSTNDVGAYILRIKAKSSSGIFLRGYTGTNRKTLSIKKSDEFEVSELELECTSVDNSIIIYSGEALSQGKEGDVIEIEWIQLTPVNDQHLVVERTKIDDTFTRVRTWGGNRQHKLLYGFDGALEKTNSISTLIKNIGINPVIIRQNQGVIDVLIDAGEKQFVNIQSDPSSTAWNQFHVRSLKSTDHLDFIASDPSIYEEPYGAELPLPTDEVGGTGKGVAKVILKNEMKKVIPKVTTDKEITLKYGEVEININAGTHLIPQLELQSGDNVIYIRGEVGTNVRFEYQEEGL